MSNSDFLFIEGDIFNTSGWTIVEGLIISYESHEKVAISIFSSLNV